MQDRRAMAVQRALGVACGARRVAQRRGGVLVEVWPDELRRISLDKVFIAEQARQFRRGRHVLAIGHYDERLDRLHAWGDRFDQRQESQIEEEDLVFSMVRDPYHLVR